MTAQAEWEVPYSTFPKLYKVGNVLINLAHVIRARYIPDYAEPQWGHDKPEARLELALTSAGNGEFDYQTNVFQGDEALRLWDALCREAETV